MVEAVSTSGKAVVDLVVEKTTSGVFNSTNVDQVLRNLSVTSLMITGGATYGCVETGTRGAGDLGYLTYLLEDATTTYTQQLHDAAISDMDHNFALVKTTSEVPAELEHAYGISAQATQSLGG